jgi:DNA helicase-2/ATP-dependent DNA helicase PcrA
MCARHSNITVVGDDAQSIYSFRGANFRNILGFPKQFEGATIVTLEQNYRSTEPILEVTNTLISRASERFTKNLWTERKGGELPWLVAAQDEGAADPVRGRQDSRAARGRNASATNRRSIPRWLHVRKPRD